MKKKYKFKVGEIVKHKTETSGKMIIVARCIWELPGASIEEYIATRVSINGLERQRFTAIELELSKK